MNTWLAYYVYQNALLDNLLIMFRVCKYDNLQAAVNLVELNNILQLSHFNIKNI